MHSDINSPDSALYVQFYEKEQVIPYESEAQGRPIMRMTDWVKIQIPGNNTLTIDTIADASHKHRFPAQWAIYQQNKDATQIKGTLLTSWPALTAAQAMEMRHYKFYTVEQIAEGTDANLVQVAAIAGSQPVALRERAKAYLNHAKESALAEHQAVELTKRDQEINALKEQVALLMSKVEAPKRGRPAKETEEA
jgi:hypothetical protein